MPFLRYCYVLTLATWVGGMVVAGLVVAPAAFSVLTGWDASTGRVLGGQVFGEVLRRLHLLAYVAGGVMLLSLTLQRLVGPRPVGYGVRATLIGIMLGLTLVSGTGINPRAAAIQRAVSGPIHALPADDDRRVVFDRLHWWSNLVFSATAIGGLALLVWEARE